MNDIAKDYALRIDELRKLIRACKSFEVAMELALGIHAITHTCEVSGSDMHTFCDAVLDGLADEGFSAMPFENSKTIAYHLWHIARIEDLVGNLLIAEQAQIFNDEWMVRLNVTVIDTGNAMDCEQILEFSKQMNKQELVNYRNAVGCRTREILKALTPSDLKRKPSTESLERVVSEGGLLKTSNSIWLKDFWGRHTVAGLVLLPLTRHHMMHLPDCMAIKKRALEKFQNNA